MCKIYALIILCFTFPAIETSMCFFNGRYLIDSYNCESVKFNNMNYTFVDVIRAYDKGPFIYWPMESNHTQTLGYPILNQELWFYNSHNRGDCVVFNYVLKQYVIIKCKDKICGVCRLKMNDYILNLINGKQIFDMNPSIISKYVPNDSDYAICKENATINKIEIKLERIANILKIQPKIRDATILCFTDSETFYPVKANVIYDSNVTFIDTKKDGYYWCQYYTKEGHLFGSSDKVLWVQRNDINRTYAVLFRYPKLFNVKLSNINRIADDLKISKYEHTLKRIYDTNEVLYHIRSTSDEVIYGENVVYVRNIFDCNLSELKGYKQIKKYEDYYLGCDDRKCEQYKCDFNYNTGSSLTKISSMSASSEEMELEYFKEDDNFYNHATSLKGGTISDVNINISPERPSTDAPKEVDSVEEVKKALEGLLFKRSINTVELAVNEVDKLFTYKANKTNLREVLGLFENILNTASITAYTQEQHYKTDNMIVSVVQSNQYNQIEAVEVTSSQKEITFLNDGKLKGITNADMIIDLTSVMSKNISQRLSVVVFEKDTLFNELSGLDVNGPIIGLSLGNGIIKPDYYIDIYIKPTVRYLDMEKSCVFWDFNIGKLGSWSKKGCELLIKQSLYGYDTCRCYHMTYFSQLIESEEQRISKGHEKALKIITYIGCSFSLLGLFGIGLTGARFKNWRSEFGNKIWMSLSASIALMILTFLLNVSLKKDTSTCILLGVFLHYSVLASFFWMSISAILCYQRLVKVFNTGHTHRLLKASLYGWLLPSIIVACLLIFDRQNYLRRVKRDSSLHSFCYPNGLGFWLTVFTPIILVILSNAVLFSLIVYSLCKGTKLNKHGDAKELKRRTTVSFLLFFLFGLTWMFGFLSTYLVFNYLFCITTAFQGFVMFSFFIVLNKNSRNLWLDRMRSSSGNSNQNSRSSNRNREHFIQRESLRLYVFNDQRNSDQLQS